MRRLNICVLMGGPSREHFVSLSSGKEVVRNLNPKKYNIVPVVISQDGKRWELVRKNDLLLLDSGMGEYSEKKKELGLKKEKSYSGINEFNKRFDLVFLALHGAYGEDGCIQGLLEMADLKYSGSGVLASALGMDKISFYNQLSSQNILYPKGMVYEKGENIKKFVSELKKKVGNFPYFIKPSNQGSSIGASIAKNVKELKKSLAGSLRYSERVLVEEYLKGKEITCGVMGNNKPYALPLVEIVPKKGSFFNYDSKYTESGADEIVPARIGKKLTKQIQKTSVGIYKLIGCRGFARVDFILKGKKYYCLEINTIPGLTEFSLLPKAAKAYGYSYSEFLNEVIKYGLEK